MERKVSIGTQSEVLRKITSLAGIRYFEEPNFYDEVRLAIQGSQFGISATADNMFSLLRNLFTVAGFILVIMVLNPLLAVLIVIGVTPQILIRLNVSRQRFNLLYELSPLERTINYFFFLLSGQFAAKEIRLFASADYLVGRFLNALRTSHSEQEAQQKREFFIEGGISLISTLFTAGAFVVVILQAVSSRFTIGDIALYLGAIQNLSSSLSNVAFTISSLNQGALYFDAYTNLMKLKQPIFISATPKLCRPLESGIQISNLSFRYPESQEWILKDLNLSINQGESLALVGPNGAGKSTLVKLLARLYDAEEGEILWDGCNIREFDVADYRKRIGIILQDFVRYEMNVRENIGLGNPERIDDLHAIHDAASKAGIGKAIEDLPQGYDTLLTKTLQGDAPGTELSGGEWQKIALARLFMRDAELLILDEPTASLDADAEFEIYRYFMDIINRETCIVISHRLAVSKFVDKIAVLENGRIVEYGTHKDLLSDNGRYARLFNLQSKQYAL
jgi:ATP-binding cassette, subfamily B, bacterial